MQKYIFLFIILVMPLQGFCDRYLVSDRKNVNRDIRTIEKDGGVIKDVRTTRLNDYDVSYTIVYENSFPLLTQETIEEFDKIINKRIEYK